MSFEENNKNVTEQKENEDIQSTQETNDSRRGSQINDKTEILLLTQPVQTVADVYMHRNGKGSNEREAKIKRFLELKNSSNPQHFNDHLLKSSEFYDPRHLENQMNHAGIKPHQVSESLLRDFYMAPLEGFIDEIGR
jgi:HCNGP-like protein